MAPSEPVLYGLQTLQHVLPVQSKDCPGRSAGKAHIQGEHFNVSVFKAKPYTIWADHDVLMLFLYRGPLQGIDAEGTQAKVSQ